MISRVTDLAAESVVAFSLDMFGEGFDDDSVISILQVLRDRLIWSIFFWLRDRLRRQSRNSLDWIDFSLAIQNDGAKVNQLYDPSSSVKNRRDRAFIIVCGTSDGQPLKIAEHIASILKNKNSRLTRPTVLQQIS
jgi:hypothetical protein